MTGRLVASLALAIITEQAAPASVRGEWRVQRWSAPGISGMTTERADLYVGKTARFEKRLAQFDVQRCDKPTYRQAFVQAEKYFLDGFRIYAKELDITARAVEIVEMSCGQDRWTGPGETLIVKDRERLLTVWDGVFFELTRSRPSKAP